MTLRKLTLGLAFFASLLFALVSTVHAVEAEAVPAQASGVPSDDLSLGERVRQAFNADKALAGMNLQIDVRAGVVYLSGKAESDSEVQRAIQLASGVAGVKAVQSDIRRN